MKNFSLKILLFSLAFLFLFFAKPLCSLSESALFWHDGKHGDIVNHVKRMLEEEGFQVCISTSQPTLSILRNYQLLLLLFDYYQQPNFNYNKSLLLSYLKKYGNFIGIGDGGFVAVTDLCDINFSTHLYSGDYRVKILNPTIFSNFSYGEEISIGYAYGYNLAFNNSFVKYPLIEMATKGWNGRIISFICFPNNHFALGITFGCGGGTNTTNCKILYRSLIKWVKDHISAKLILSFKSINITKQDIFLLVTTYEQLPNGSAIVIDEFGSQNFILLISNLETQLQEFENLGNGTYLLKAKLPKNLLGYRKLRVIVTYKNKTFENSTTIFIPKPKLGKKLLFITNSSWKNILSLVPLRKLTLVTDKIDSSIKNFIELYKPENLIILGKINGTLDSENVYYINSYKDIPRLFFGSDKGIYVGDEKEKAILISLIASVLNKPIVFNESLSIGLNLTKNSTSELEKFYLNLLKTSKVNYLIVSKGNFLDALIASSKNAYLILVNTINTTCIKEKIRETIDKLNRAGLFVESPDYLKNDAYILLIDIPSIKLEDPVEKSFGLNDKQDGYYFYSDLEYADLNNDGYLDLPIGRLPSDYKIASLMFARSFLGNNKKALIAAEYLHTSWPIILLYGGSGMMHAKNIEKILQKQGFKTKRIVEHRAKPLEFLTSLTPNSIKKFLKETKRLSELIGKILGKTAASIAYKVFIIIKALEYAEQGLEIYLEYDWSTFGPKLKNAIALLNELNASNPISLDNAIKLVYLLWPNPLENLTKSTLIEGMKDSALIYYEGLGNGEYWILPNLESKNRYDGLKNLTSKDIQDFNSILIWDNSDLAANGSLYLKFLEKGSAAFLGASALNYAPFSAEIDSRFFKRYETIGRALIEAINDFREDWFTWDPLNLFRRGIKAKTLREFILFGDPSIRKDPEIEIEPYNFSLECKKFCIAKFSFRPNITIMNLENKSWIIYDKYAYEPFKPIIPIEKFTIFLTNFSNLSFNYSLKYSFLNQTGIATLSLLSHSLTNLTFTLNFTGLYPEKEIYNRSYDLIDGRKKIVFILPILRVYPNGSSFLVEKLELTLKYLPFIDFYLKGKDCRINEKCQIEVNIVSFKDKNATFYLKIFPENKVIERDLKLKEGNNKIKISFRPEQTGLHKMEAYLKYNPIIGPRFSYFNVLPEVKEKVEEREEIEVYSSPFIPPNISKPKIENISLKSICGNGICEFNESLSCPEDCIVKAKPVNLTIKNVTKPKEVPTGYFVFPSNIVIAILLTCLAVLIFILLKSISFS